MLLLDTGYQVPDTVIASEAKQRFWMPVHS